MKSAALFLAKTPGVSPVKTRLAIDSSQEFAEEFYSLSVNCCYEMGIELNKLSKGEIVPFWAIGEEQGLQNTFWTSKDLFKKIWTGYGNLGQRLNAVYTRLKRSYNYVFLIGTDSPHLSAQYLYSNFLELKEYKEKCCFIGPCTDGGYYIFCSRENIKSTVFEDVTYSNSETYKMFTQNLEKEKFIVKKLEANFDVDTIYDLKTLEKYFDDKKGFSQSQKSLYRWINKSND